MFVHVLHKKIKHLKNILHQTDEFQNDIADLKILKKKKLVKYFKHT